MPTLIRLREIVASDDFHYEGVHATGLDFAGCHVGIDVARLVTRQIGLGIKKPPRGDPLGV